MQIEKRFTTIRDTHGEMPIEYLVAGAGPELLLLHGVGDSAETWRWTMPALARHYRVYAPSMPGFGQSAVPEADYTPAFFAAFAAAFLDALAIERAAVVGNSLGGLAALRLALAAPDRVSALGLVDSAGLGRELSLALRILTVPGLGRLATLWHRTALGARMWALNVTALLLAHPRRAPTPWREQLYHMARRPGYLEATVASVRGGSTLVGQRRREILRDALPQLTMPTLIVWGEHDRIVPVKHARAAAARLPGSKLVVLPDCGHLPHVDAPDRFAAIVTDFLQAAEAQQFSARVYGA